MICFVPKKATNTQVERENVKLKELSEILKFNFTARLFVEISLKSYENFIYLISFFVFLTEAQYLRGVEIKLQDYQSFTAAAVSRDMRY